MLFRTSNELGMECSNKFFLTADIISLAVDSGVTSGNKLGKLFKIIVLSVKHLQTPFSCIQILCCITRTYRIIGFLHRPVSTIYGKIVVKLRFVKPSPLHSSIIASARPKTKTMLKWRPPIIIDCLLQVDNY